MIASKRFRGVKASVLAVMVAASCFVAGDRADGYSWFQVDGINVVWAGGTTVRYMSPSTFPQGSDTFNHFLAAMGLWNLVPAADFEYQYFLLDQDYPVDHFDGYSDTYAVDAGSLDPGVLGVTYMVNNGAQWFDMDMEFSDFPVGAGWFFEPNPSCDLIANPTPSNGFSFLLVATHELGHALGLGHDPIGDEPAGSSWFIGTMNPRYPSGGPIGQENIIELHTDDRNGLRYLYPHSGPSEPPLVDLASASYTSSAVIGKAIPIYFTPASILPGDTLTARSVIENFGTTSEVQVRQGFYLSTDEVIETGDMLLGDLRWDLAFGDAFEFEALIDMPADMEAGDYYLGYILDDLDEVAEEYEDNNAAVYCSPLTIAQLTPVINTLPQDATSCGVAYTGPAPTFTHPLNMNPATWTIDNPEPGMTIDPATGVLSWPNPIRSEFLYTITLRATNSGGTSTTTLFLGVTESAPEIAPIPSEETGCGVSYVGLTPQITLPSCMTPIINWSLDEGPVGMEIDFGTGVVSWPNPTRAGSPHVVTIRATNGIGNGTQTWSLDVVATSDRDGDGDTDIDDYGVFASCLLGPGEGAAGACECVDLDGDSDVDLIDLAAFSRAFNGALVGACCGDDGSCFEDSPAVCAVGGGTFAGDGSTCASAVCTGACCLSNGFCLDLSADNCAGAGGAFHGIGSECATTSCVTGACCHADESCTEESEGTCLAGGGTYLGDVTTCGVSTCVTVVGSCCDPVGWICSETDSASCAAAGGIYGGDGTTCASAACPEYSNEIDPVETWYAPGAGSAMADDITLGGADRAMAYYDLSVYGGGSGAFDVTVALYTGCPGDGGTMITGTDAAWTGVPDDGQIYVLSADLSQAPVIVPDTVWMVATFSTADAGWILAEAAEVGTTADLFGQNDPPWGCEFALDGTPAPYSGFWANVECIPAGGATLRSTENLQPLVTMQRRSASMPGATRYQPKRVK